MNKDQTVCRICKKKCKYLGSHITTKHKISAREYKEEFELPYNLPLVSEEIQNKMRDKFNEKREYYLKNGLKNIQKHFFQKGKDGHRRVSESERKKFIERIKQVNKEKRC